MAAPYTTFDFEWVRGTTKPDFVVTFTKNGVPVSFDDAVLSVYNKGGKSLAFRVSILGHLNSPAQLVHDPDQGKITFTPTAEQTRSLTQTKADGAPQNKYELELRNGDQEQVYLMGNILGTGGLNSDESTEDVS
jgi:hypothetical protein